MVVALHYTPTAWNAESAGYMITDGSSTTSLSFPSDCAVVRDEPGRADILLNGNLHTNSD